MARLFWSRPAVEPLHLAEGLWHVEQGMNKRGTRNAEDERPNSEL